MYHKGNGQPAKLYCMGHVRMDHQHGLPVDVEVTEADGYAERTAALAILDRQPARGQRMLAADLLNTLIASNALGEWSYASRYLPARQAAFAFWPEDDPYVLFAREQLSRARAMPVSSASSIMTVLNNAVFDVVTLAKTPQVAAEEAVAALQP